jgi:hypothetical protein
MRQAELEQEWLAEGRKRERLAQVEKEMLAEPERDRLAQERRLQERSGSIPIIFNIRERGGWGTASSLLVDPLTHPRSSESRKVHERTDRVLSRRVIYTEPSRMFSSCDWDGEECLIYLIPEKELDIGNETVSPIPGASSDAGPEPEGKKGRQ